MPDDETIESAPPVRTCRVCGCTDAAACEGGCSWVADDLCSACADPDRRPAGSRPFMAPIIMEGATQKYIVHEGSAMTEDGVVKLAYLQCMSPMSTTEMAMSEETATTIRDELDRIFGPRPARLHVARELPDLPPGFSQP